MQTLQGEPEMGIIGVASGTGKWQHTTAKGEEDIITKSRVKATIIDTDQWSWQLQLELVTVK